MSLYYPIFLTLIFIGELFLLFYLSKGLHKALANLFLGITRSYSSTVNLMAILFLPGTIIHELAHLLVAGVLMVPVGEIDLVPEINRDSTKLGSVEIGQTDPFRRILIGVAPVLIGVGLIAATLSLLPISASSPPWQIALSGYIVFELANTMFSSKKDLEGALAFLITLGFMTALLSLGLYLAGMLPSLSLIDILPHILPSGFIFMMITMLLAPIVLDILFILLLKVFKGGSYARMR